MRLIACSRIVIICSILIYPSRVFARDSSLAACLEQFQSSAELKALDLDIQSLQLEIQAREFELSPTINVNAVRFWDDRPSLSSSQQSKGFASEVKVIKPFATGTDINLTSGLETSAYRSTLGDQNLLNWELGVTQSLWKNSFGHQTRLRRQRDQSELQSRLLVLVKKRQDLLIEFETRYWDLAFATQDVRLKEDGLNRSRRILSWIQDRYDRAAAEGIDLLQGRTLVASRELQLQVAQDDFKTAQVLLNERLASQEEITPGPSEMIHKRDLFSLPVRTAYNSENEPVLIDALQSKAEAQFLKLSSELEADKLKPTLQVGYTYGQQGLDTSFSRARDEAFSSNNHYHEIGVLFSMPLDFVSINKSRRSTEAASQAEQFRSVQSHEASVLGWEDLKRTVREQQHRVDKAGELLKLQQDKSREEQARYEKGRTTVFQVLTFEQEAADSEFLLLQVLSQLRRTEAKARIYAVNPDNTP